METFALKKERSTAELFSQYAGVLWHWLWLLALMAVLSGGTAFFISSYQTPTYQATTLIIINGAPNTLTDSYSAIYVSQQLAPTYAQVMTTSPVLDAAAQKLGLTTFPGLAKVTPITNTQLMRVTVTDTDPTRAAMLANALVEVFSDQLQADQTSRYADSKKNLEDQMASLDNKIQDTTASITNLGQQIADTNGTLSDTNLRIQKATLYPELVDPVSAAADLTARDKLQEDLARYESEKAQLEVTQGQYQQSYYYLLQSLEELKLAEAQSIATILQKDPAKPIYEPIQPQPVRSAFLAGMVGLMIAAGIIFLIEFLDDTIKTTEEVENRLGVSVLGHISEISTKEIHQSGIYVGRQPRSPVAEAFRSLRTNLEFAEVDHPLRTIMVTSAGPGEGKSTIASNLATIIAQSNRKVTLLDADLRKPAVHRIFRLPNRIGLTDLFRNRLELAGVINNSDEIKGLRIITSGPLPPNPSDLLASARMERILEKIGESSDVLIIDTPPAMVADAQVISSRVDCVLLVIQPGKTHVDSAIATMEQFQRTGARVVGAVMNRITRRSSRYYSKYRYNVKYYYQAKAAPTTPKPNESQSIKLSLPAWLKPVESNGHNTLVKEPQQGGTPVVPEDSWPNRPLLPVNPKDEEEPESVG
jgi:polysaccharide biosynthesis transport protein